MIALPHKPVSVSVQPDSKLKTLFLERFRDKDNIHPVQDTAVDQQLRVDSNMYFMFGLSEGLGWVRLKYISIDA